MKKNIAIIGNPNSGKTTLFNKLTGSNQHVGNWPGVTVDKKTGTFCYDDTSFDIVDLPGIYSLSPYTKEEIIAREYILENKIDIILSIVDSTNLERNLYLTLQLLALGKPMVIALNFIDDLKQKETIVNVNALSELLGVTVVPISAKKSENINYLLEVLTKEVNPPKNVIDYKPEIKQAIYKINKVLEIENNNFFAQKLIENDIEIEKNLKLNRDQKEKISQIINEISSEITDKEMLMPDAMYDFIVRTTKKSVEKAKNPKKSITEKIDEIVTHKYFAIPIFAIIMYIMFSTTFGSFGSFLSDRIDVLINENLVSVVNSFFETISAPDWIIGFICDGIIGGVGGILTFLPQILILFFFLSILEDTGYLARIAFIMDTLLQKIGLSGKSFIPMLMGFGCTTPAVMSARTMENEQDRKMTIMLTPFMSCSAKLPVYALFAAAFFDKNQGIITFSIYLLGIFVAIISGLLLKNTLFKGISSNFVLELPDYRMPTIDGTFKNMITRAKDFIVKAGTIIFAMSVVIWFLQNFTFTMQMTDDSTKSMLGVFGMMIAPLFSPLGFGNWQASVSLLTGLIAKEAVVSTMSVLYGTDLENVIKSMFTPLSAYAFMAFTLLYIPCISAFAAIKREMGSMKWALFVALFQTGMAYIVAFLIFQIGSIFIR